MEKLPVDDLPDRRMLADGIWLAGESEEEGEWGGTKWQLRWAQAFGRLNRLQVAIPDVSDVTQLCREILKRYGGYQSEELSLLNPQQLTALALSEMNQDLLLISSFNADGSLSSSARRDYPRLGNVDDYHFVGMDAAAFRQMIAMQALGQLGSRGLEGLTLEERKRDLIDWYNSRISADGKPAIIAVAGRISLGYNNIIFVPATDYIPPYGGDSYNVTFFWRKE